MRKLIQALAAGYVGLFASTADATPLILSRTTIDNGWEKARMNCDQFGRCWKERSSMNALLESYQYAPPQEREDRILAAKGSVRIGSSIW